MIFNLETEGFWQGKDFNRQDTFFYYQLYFSAEDDEYRLVIDDLPENPGMSVSNCIELLAAELIEHLQVEGCRVEFYEHTTEADAPGNLIHCFDEVVFGSRRQSAQTAAAAGTFHSPKTIFSDPRWSRKNFSPGEEKGFLEPHLQNFFTHAQVLMTISGAARPAVN